MFWDFGSGGPRMVLRRHHVTILFGPPLTATVITTPSQTGAQQAAAALWKLVVSWCRCLRSRFVFAKAKASPRVDVDETSLSAAADVQQKGSILIGARSSFTLLVLVHGLHHARHSLTCVVLLAWTAWRMGAMSMRRWAGCLDGISLFSLAEWLRAHAWKFMGGWWVVLGPRTTMSGTALCASCHCVLATKRQCFRSGFSRADSDRMASNQGPPRVDRLLSVVRSNLLLGGNLHHVPLLKGKATKVRSMIRWRCSRSLTFSRPWNLMSRL